MGRCGVETCPCNDGDPCNYEDHGNTKAMPHPDSHDGEPKKKPSGQSKPWAYLGWQGDQPTIDGLPTRVAVSEAQAAALPILAAHVEWWLHSQEHQPMPHPVDVLEDAVRASEITPKETP